MAFFQDMPWHEGEEKIREAMKAPFTDNPTVPTLSPQLSNHLQTAPLIAIGTIDAEGQPWTTLWGSGEQGLSRPIAQGIIGIKTPVTGSHDPVVEILFGKEARGEIKREEGQGRMVGGLTIDLETRKRVKTFGRMVAGALSMREDEVTGEAEAVAEVQLVLKIEQSLGNCPKYINSKKITAASAKPVLESNSPQLSQDALNLIAKADLFFISSAQHDTDMDTNHRGGPAGFVRVISNAPSGAVICYPEYSGNRLYQTLGNLSLNPRAGLCIPDFENGSILHLTGTTQIHIGPDAAALLPRSNLAVTLTVTSARHITTALPFRGVLGAPSPYNPAPRFLATEKPHPTSTTAEPAQQTATLLRQTPLTPTISRYTFHLPSPSLTSGRRPGQYVTLDFAPHLSLGYQHMDDSDPRSLNDDFVRTFTVSSPPAANPNPVHRLKDDEFEVVVRNVGAVTGFLARHAREGAGRRAQQEVLEVGVMGFGGEFVVETSGEGECGEVAFVAGGVGITPLLAFVEGEGSVRLEGLRVLWSLRGADLGFAVDVAGRTEGLGKRMEVFVTGEGADEGVVRELERMGVSVRKRRMEGADLKGNERRFGKYYICAAPQMRKQVMEWLPGEEMVFEDFDF